MDWRRGAVVMRIHGQRRRRHAQVVLDHDERLRRNLGLRVRSRHHLGLLVLPAASLAHSYRCALQRSASLAAIRARRARPCFVAVLHDLSHEQSVRRVSHFVAARLGFHHHVECSPVDTSAALVFGTVLVRFDACLSARLRLAVAGPARLRHHPECRRGDEYRQTD